MNVYFWSWVALAIVVLILAVYRIAVASHDDETLHLHQNEGALIAAQQKLSRRVTAVDQWGMLLTAVLAIYSLVLLSNYLYHTWVKVYQIQ